MADDCPKCPPVGAAPWLATFADLMSLLMCFFVLLLSFATIDAVKFKRMSLSMQSAFGVQKEVVASEIPMGTSIIAQHFSPARTEPTPLEEVKQSSNEQSTQLNVSIDKMADIKKKVLDAKIKEIESQTEVIKEALVKEIAEGRVFVERDGLKIIIRINEKGSFPSGSAILEVGFEPVMAKITEVVNDSVGIVHVAGHTDNIPISTDWFRSNWELSVSRSVTVAHFMLTRKGTNPNRIVVEGFADTKPLLINDTAENRAKNRRVEIIIIQEDPTKGIKPTELSVNLDKLDILYQTDGLQEFE